MRALPQEIPQTSNTKSSLKSTNLEFHLNLPGANELIKLQSRFSQQWINGFSSLKPRQHGCQFPDDIFNCIFLNANVWFSITMSLNFVPWSPIDNIPALVQVMVWCHPGDNLLSELKSVRLPTHICVTRLGWVSRSGAAFNLVCRLWRAVCFVRLSPSVPWFHKRCHLRWHVNRAETGTEQASSMGYFVCEVNFWYANCRCKDDNDHFRLMKDCYWDVLDGMASVIRLDATLKEIIRMPNIRRSYFDMPDGINIRE